MRHKFLPTKAHTSPLPTSQAVALAERRAVVDCEAQQSQAHLLALPAELFDLIIMLAVVKHDKITRIYTTKSRQHDLYEHDPKSALANTCARLRAIALPIYYGQNTFAFKSPNDAVAWLDTRPGEKDRMVVRHHFVEMTHWRKLRRKPEWSTQRLHVVEMVLAGANTLTAIVRGRRKGERQ